MASEDQQDMRDSQDLQDSTDLHDSQDMNDGQDVSSQEVSSAHAIDRTDEYNKFIEDLKEYHEKRGTVFEPEPKVGPVPLDLLKVFKHIVDAGGYDKVSDEKLAWRRMASELGIHSRNESTAGFYLKEKFYKNLAAYEISTVHKQEPPPKEILEDVSAKGAGLLTRTLGNYRKRERAANESPAPSGDSTPAREKPTADTPSSSVRASRGLREQPPQRVIFQPETGPSRTRQSSTQHSQQNGASNHNGTNGSFQQSQMALTNGHGAHQVWRSIRGASAGSVVPDWSNQFAPKTPLTFPFRPVDTPTTNPTEFLRRRQPMRMAPDPVRQALAKHFEGPNIYSRCMMALRSGMFAEQSYALYHLVRISFEQGHRFRFESFPGLADALMEKVLEVGSLFYHVKWRVSWFSTDSSADSGVLSGTEGTPDILERIEALEPRVLSESVQPEAFVDAVNQASEAALVVRNLMLLTENAVIMANAPLIRDVLCIVLSLPSHESVTELKNYALDIAETLTPFVTLDSEDPLYKTLVGQLLSQDRGIILTSLHALARISVNLDAANKLEDIPAPVLQRLAEWMLLNDEDMLDACLDFLYQYTAVVKNVDTLLRSITPEHLVTHLVRLLSHGARKTYREVVLVPESREPYTHNSGKEVIPEMPSDLMDELVQMEEASRVQQWVRSMFEEDEASSVTQLAVWQTYQATFSAVLKAHGKAQIQPARFIQTSVGVYDGSQAQVTKPDDSGQQKFIIRGIRPRPAPVSISGREYQRCLWSTDPDNRPQKCGRFFLDSAAMWRHIMEDHLDEKRGPAGFENKEREVQCTWAYCTKYSQPTALDLSTFSRHLMVHTAPLWSSSNGPSALPSSTLSTPVEPQSQSQSPTKPSSSSSAAAPTGPRKGWVTPARTFKLAGEETVTTRDERTPNAPPQAGGVPLSAVLVLRNIARNVHKTDAEEELVKENEKIGRLGGWNERLFRLALPRLHELYAENKALSPYIGSLFDLIYEDPEFEAAVAADDSDRD